MGGGGGRLLSSSLRGRRKENRTRSKTLHFLMLQFSLSECLEQVVISHIAVLYLSGTGKCRVIYTVYRVYALEDPLKKYRLSNTQVTAQKHFLW